MVQAVRPASQIGDVTEYKTNSCEGYGGKVAFVRVFFSEYFALIPVSVIPLTFRYYTNLNTARIREQTTETW